MERPTEYNYYLPKEILLFIFKFFDRNTLVYSCRPVCRFWKEAVECTDVWKIQISREAKPFTSELQNILPTAHLNYPWYMCYVLCKNIFYKNLLPDCCAEENLYYWSDVLNRSSGRVSTGPLQIHSQGYSVVPQGLLDEGVTNCLLISFGNSCLKEIIDLYSCGFTRKIFELRPPIHISEWFGVGYHYSAMCHLEVAFFNSQWKRDTENGFYRNTRLIRNRQWNQLTYTFSNYRPDIRYITFNHGVNTFLGSRSAREEGIGDLTNVAAKVAVAKVVVTLPEVRESSDSD